MMRQNVEPSMNYQNMASIHVNKPVHENSLQQYAVLDLFKLAATFTAAFEKMFTFPDFELLETVHLLAKRMGITVKSSSTRLKAPYII